MAYNINTRVVLKNINKDKVGTIFIEIAFHHKMTKDKIRRYESTGQRLHQDDISKGQIKQAERTRNIRDIVEKKIVEVKETLRKLELIHHEISPNIYDKSKAPNEYAHLNVLELFDEYIKYQEAEHEPLTVKKHKTVKALLAEYSQTKKIKTLYLHDIDQTFYKDFTKFLKRTKKHSKPTISKYQAGIKSFLKYLTKELGLNQEKVHEDFERESVRNIGGSSVVLLKEHIEKLKEWETDNQRYEIVRDLFLFQILTGIRYSDLINVNKSYVVGDSLSFIMFKVKKRVTIPLHTYAKQILLKYNYDLGDKCKALQNYNLDLKTVCKMAGLIDKIKTLNMKLNKTVEDEELWQMVSTHVGRTTFITNCLISGITPYIVMDYTGHSKIQTLSTYMRLAGSMSTDAFTRFENYIDL